MTTAYINCKTPSLDEANTKVQKSKPNWKSFSPSSLESTTFSRLKMKMRMGAHDLKFKELRKALKQQKARLYIIRRCVAMLITWHD